MITRYATSEHNTDNRDQLMDLFNSDVELLRVSWIILPMDNYVCPNFRLWKLWWEHSSACQCIHSLLHRSGTFPRARVFII